MKIALILSLLVIEAVSPLMVKGESVSCREKVTCIANGNRSIYGVESVAENGNGIAIISHGFNGTGEFGRQYFDTLNKLGYTVYSFDFPCGSVRSRSDNNTVNMSVIDEKNDLKAIVRYFLNRPDAAVGPVLLIGESQGGLVSALAASELGDTVSGLLLIYPALCIPDNWNSRYKTEHDIPDTTRVWNVPVGSRFFKELRQMNVYDNIAMYKGPVQIIHGSKDAIVPVSYSEEAVRRYGNAGLKVIPGAGHGFKEQERAISNKTVEEFLVRSSLTPGK